MMFSLLLCGAHAAQERTGDRQFAIRELERQGGEGAGGRTAQDARAIFGIEGGGMTWANKVFLIVCPAENVAPRVWTDCRIANDTLDRDRAGWLSQVFWRETNQEHAIETRPIAERLCRRIRGVNEYRRTSNRQGLRSNHLALVLAKREEKNISRLWPQFSRVLRVASDEVDKLKAEPHAKSGFEHRASTQQTRGEAFFARE
jgi:hypothetical protein